MHQINRLIFCLPCSFSFYDGKSEIASLVFTSRDGRVVRQSTQRPSEWGLQGHGPSDTKEWQSTYLSPIRAHQRVWKTRMADPNPRLAWVSLWHLVPTPTSQRMQFSCQAGKFVHESAFIATRSRFLEVRVIQTLSGKGVLVLLVYNSDVVPLFPGILLLLQVPPFTFGPPSNCLHDN